MAMVDAGHRVDLVTRWIDDPQWPEFSAEVDYYDGFSRDLRIVRIACGGPGFLNKEQLWDHLGEFVENTVAFYGSELPDFVTAHYADGGYSAALFNARTGLRFTFTGHSLGAQKLDKLGMSSDNALEMNRRFHFDKRIAAERLAMKRAFRIVTSTTQERMQQYSHPLYQGAVEPQDDKKFSVIPPGVNQRVFTTTRGPLDDSVGGRLNAHLKNPHQPHLLVSSRLDEKKNIIGAVQGYVESAELQAQAGLVVCVRGIADPFTELAQLSAEEQTVLGPILELIDSAGLRDRVDFLDIRSQLELAAVYRYFAAHGSVFVLTAFYEPFGLAPIEAAACGLACVATANGGPSEIFEDGSGVLVDPFDSADIARGMADALVRSSELARLAADRVDRNYTWHKTAVGYLSVASAGRAVGSDPGEWVTELNGGERLSRYLASRGTTDRR